MAHLSDWLARTHQRFFVGRAAEVELFRQWLLADEPPYNLLYFFAPGGVGKTSLLHEYARLAAEAGLSTCWVDGRHVLQLSPAGFHEALRQAGGEAMPDDLAGWLLLIDTFELLAPLHHWLRERFLPGLSPRCRVVIAGRTPPDPEWQTDLAWRELARFVSLRNLTPEESRTLLDRFGVPPDHHPAALACTHGHPLALVLVADLLKRQPVDVAFDLSQAPDVVRVLVERFVREVPTPMHRQALELCAHVRATTEALLAEVLGPEDGHAAFTWLRGLSFVEHGPDGLFPHDLVRDALDTDLRWRNPEAYRQMHRLARRHTVRRFLDQGGSEQQQAFLDMIYMHRRQPVMQPFFAWQSLGSAYIDPAGPQDYPAILEMVRRHEGEASARIADFWLQRQPEAFLVFRLATDPLLLGFAANLVLTTVTPEEEAADPAIRAAWGYVRRYGPLRPGECFLYHRFWMGRETYQEPATPAHNLVSIIAGRAHFATPNLAWAFPAGVNPDFWEPMWAYLNFQRAPEADFEVGGRRYGVFAHDWRVEPFHVWLERMGERELDLEFKPEHAAPSAPPPLVVLSQPEFAGAVRQALRDYVQPDVLAANPLLRSRVLRDAAGPSPQPADLQGLLRQAAETLQAVPKDEKLYRALENTYLRPAPTQEAAAERLDLPFSTYRYHLTRAIERVTDWLWQRELYGPAGTAP